MGSDEVEGTAVDLMTGPTGEGTSSSRLTFAVDAAGNLLSIEVDLGQTDPGRIELPQGPARGVGRLVTLRPR